MDLFFLKLKAFALQQTKTKPQSRQEPFKVCIYTLPQPSRLPVMAL